MSGRGGSVGAPDATDVEHVADCMLLLQGAAAKVRLYGEEHPQTVHAVEKFIGQLNEILNWLGPVTLETSPTGLIWRGHPVSNEGDDRSGVGRHCHTEGISLLGFMPGVIDAEVHRFLNAIRVNLSLPQYEEETLESLLFQAEMSTITFRAISSLMDAEALSGRDDDGGIERYLSQQLIEPQSDDVVGGRRLSGVLDPRDLAGGDVVDQWNLDAAIDEGTSDDEWAERFATEVGEDLPIIDKIRDSVRLERSSQLLSRLTIILLRADCARRPELKGKGHELAQSSVRQIYALGDPVGILDVLHGGHSLSEEVRVARPDLTERVREFLRSAYSPLRVARLLRNLTPDDDLERGAINRFVEILPDTALLAFFEGVSREADLTAYRPLLRHVCHRATPKLKKWLAQAVSLPTDQLEPIVHGLRGADLEDFRPIRPQLMRHNSGRVRAATLRWYEESLPDRDVEIVAEMLLDRTAAVRDAAARALVRHRPQRAVQMLAAELVDPGFGELEADLKIELCAVYGRLAGPRGLQVLSDLLSTRTGLLRDEAAAGTVTAAARGLAALGTANAIRALEKGARSLNGVRKAACQSGLAVFEAEKRTQESGRG